MPDYYSPEGEPMEMMEWVELFERRHSGDDSWWRKQTEVDGVRVSTVWIGLDHSFGFGRPLFWETTIFGGDRDEDQWRYSSKEDALAHHAAIVDALKAGDEIPDAAGVDG